MATSPAAYMRSLGFERMVRTGEKECAECSGYGTELIDGREFDCQECQGEGVVIDEEEE